MAVGEGVGDEFVVDVVESGEGETDFAVSAVEGVDEGSIDDGGADVDVGAKATAFSSGSSIPSRLLYTARSTTAAMITATRASIAATVPPVPDLLLDGLACG